jgi:hypothetical protein
MKKAIFFIFIVTFFPSLMANDDLERLVTLAEDSRDIVVELENPQDEFVLDEETSDFIFLYKNLIKKLLQLSLNLLSIPIKKHQARQVQCLTILVVTNTPLIKR